MVQVVYHKFLEISLARKGVQPFPTPPSIYLCALMAGSYAKVIHSGRETQRILKLASFIKSN